MKTQRGGFFLGMIVGLLVGLGIALCIALYIAKVPIPFVNKVPQRTPDQDAAQAERNKNWDPNGALAIKAPLKQLNSASSGGVLPPQTPDNPVPEAAPTKENRDPAAILADLPPTAAAGTSTKPALETLSYYIQAGAYGRIEDADQQRAKLGMLGFTAKITEREQSGRTVFRVRLGPFEKREEADEAKEKLDGAGVESAMIRVQK